jgi:RHS repeat-associated protein
VPTLTRILFTGQEYDPRLKTYVHDYRIYDPLSGRWTKDDPITFAAGQWNLQIRTHNDPVNYTDPTGLHFGLVLPASQSLWAVGSPEYMFLNNIFTTLAQNENFVSDSIFLAGTADTDGNFMDRRMLAEFTRGERPSSMTGKPKYLFYTVTYKSSTDCYGQFSQSTLTETIIIDLETGKYSFAPRERLPFEIRPEDLAASPNNPHGVMRAPTEYELQRQLRNRAHELATEYFGLLRKYHDVALNQLDKDRMAALREELVEIAGEQDVGNAESAFYQVYGTARIKQAVEDIASMGRSKGTQSQARVRKNNAARTGKTPSKTPPPAPKVDKSTTAKSTTQKVEEQCPPKGYGHLSDKTKIEPGRPFQTQQKEKVLGENRKRNGGKLISDDPNDPWYGKELQGPGPRRFAGDKVPNNEAQVDHIVPRIGPDGKPLGTNDYSNARVISAEYNRILSNKGPKAP